MWWSYVKNIYPKSWTPTQLFGSSTPVGIGQLVKVSWAAVTLDGTVVKMPKQFDDVSMEWSSTSSWHSRHLSSALEGLLFLTSEAGSHHLSQSVDWRRSVDCMHLSQIWWTIVTACSTRWSQIIYTERLQTCIFPSWTSPFSQGGTRRRANSTV